LSKLKESIVPDKSPRIAENTAIETISQVSNQRSPFTLSALEGVVIILAIIVNEVSLYYGLGSGIISHADPNSPWMMAGRQKLFSTFALPLGMILLIPAVSLVRSIRKDVLHHTT
jgi:hypothetical protein